jgi:hypothetical protein
MAAGKAWTARAVEIRDHVLPLIRQHGELQREPFGTQFIVDAADPADAQNCITVNYIVIFDGGNVVNRGEGLWTLEIPDHALGRMLHRSKAGSIAEAHHAALRMRLDDATRNRAFDRDFQFLLPAGSGAFVCSLCCGIELSQGGERSMHVRVHTWLSTDQLRDDQTLLIDDGGAGARLGDGWLLPSPLRQIVGVGLGAP